MSYQKILVTLDGSELAEAALAHIAKVADVKAEIHILSIIGSIYVEPISEPVHPMATVMNAMYGMPGVKGPAYQRINNPVVFQERSEYLRRVGDRLREMGYTVFVTVEPGDVVDSIVRMAEDGFDLVIMATHGRSGLSRWVLGSVAEAVLHQAPCPVLLVPTRPAQK